MNTQQNASKVYPLVQKLKSFLFHDSYLPPQLFFTFVLLQQVGLLSLPFSVQGFFYLGILLLLLSFFNHFLFYSATLNNNLGMLMPMNILMGLLGCNQKWKFFLFCFSLVFYLPSTCVQIKQLFIILLSAIVCLQTFFTLMFPTPKQNLWFFCGFFALFFLHTSIFILQYCFGVQLDKIQKLFMVPVTLLFGYGMIKIKFSNMLLKQIGSDFNPGQIMHKINLMTYQFQFPQKLNNFLYAHQESCLEISCFCKKYNKESVLQEDLQSDESIKKNIINSFFIKSFDLKSWERRDKFELIHNYANFLADCGQLTKSISILSMVNENQLQYFGKCDNFRIKQKVADKISRNIYFDNLNTKVELLSSLDLQTGSVNKQIREILKERAEYWTQLCKQNPHLQTLQKKGRNLVTRIESLHSYFMLKIRPCQEMLSIFRCTYIYATYLLLTTNYLQFANSLIKKTNKITQQSLSRNEAGTQYGLFLEISQNNKRKDRQYQNQLIIKNISSSLCKMLNKPKQQLLNCNITKIIPEQFRFVHDTCFDRFINSNNFQLSRSSLIGQTLELPFRVSKGQAIFLTVSSQLRYDPISNKALVQCMLVRKTNNTVNFIMNLEGRLLYQESQLFKDYSGHGEIKKCVQKLKAQYVRDCLLQNLQSSFEEDENLVKIHCSPMFINKFNAFNIEPLLKIVIKSDSFKNEKVVAANFDAGKVQEQNKFDSIHHETDSQASTASRKDSISNVLSCLTQSNSLKKQPFLTVTLMSFAIVSIICFHILKDEFKIWNTSIKEETPTYSIMNLVNYKIISNFAVGEIYDSIKTANNTQLKTYISKNLFGNVPYDQFIFQRYSTFMSMQKKFIYGTFFEADNEVTRKAKQLLEKQTNFENQRYPNLIPQNMTLQSMMSNLISSIYFAQNGYDPKRLILFSVYLPLFYKQFTNIIDTVTQDLQNSIHSIKRNNIILVVLGNLILIAFVVPLWKFNWQNKKEFLKIYNLFACLNVKFILRQIEKLQKIENCIFANVNQTDFYQTSNKMDSFAATNQKIKEPIKLQKNGKDTQNYDNHNDHEKQSFVKGHKDLQMIKIRKRGADLNIDGSDCDKKAFLMKDWIPVIFIIFLLIIFNVLFYVKYMHIQSVENQFKVSNTVISFIEDTSVALTCTKMFMDDYSTANPSYVFGEDLQQWLKNWIVSFRKKFNFYLSIENDVLSCPNSPMVCKNPFSLRLFEGMVKNYISKGYQSKKDLLRNNSSENIVKHLKVRLSLMLGTYLLTEVNKNYIQWISASYVSLEEQQRQRDNNITVIIRVFWAVIVAYLIFCIAYITYRKFRYVNEVTLLSLLNKQMIYNNKNVESFLVKISKSLK